MLLKECDAYPFMSTAKVSRQAQPPLARFKLEACTKADIFVSQPTLDLHQYIYIHTYTDTSVSESISPMLSCF